MTESYVPQILVATDRPEFAARGFWQAVAAEGVAVEVVAMVDTDDRWSRREPAAGMTEVRVPRRPHHELLRERFLERPGASSQLALGLLHSYTPAYGEALEIAAQRSAIVVADGGFAGPALLRHTARPLLLDLRDRVGASAGPNASDPSGGGDLARLAAQLFATSLRAASLIRGYSARQEAALTRLAGRSGRPVVTVPEAGEAVAFVAPDVRADYRRRCGLEQRPIVLASAAVSVEDVRLRSLSRELGAEVITSIPPGQLPELLALADAAIALDLGAGPGGELLTWARAGVPLLAEAGPLADAGLDGETAVVLGHDGAGLLPAVAAILGRVADATVAARVRAAHRVAQAQDQRVAARALLGDPRVAAMLDWHRPAIRRPRQTRARNGAAAL